MKTKDIKLIGTIAFIILLVYLISLSGRSDGSFVKITQNGELIGIYDLKEDNNISLENNNIIIKNHQVYMESANCPDKLCVNQGKISSSGQSIVCLPQKLAVEIIENTKVISKNAYYFNTEISLTIYDSNDENILDEAIDICSKYELICSRTNPQSELYKLNNRLLEAETTHDGNTCYQISDELYDMISLGLAYGKETDGVFNIAIAPVSGLWDFTSKKSQLPDENLISQACQYAKLDDIILYPNKRIGFKHKENMIDLGGLAKGYIADRLKEYLESQNVSSAIISLGGNILCVGNKLGKPFKVGVRDPYNRASSITYIEADNNSIVTSGITERYFEKDGHIYHHILDSKNGYPIENDLLSATVICQSSAMGDCLSTYMYALGSDEALKYASQRDDIDIILVTKDMDVIQTNK